MIRHGSMNRSKMEDIVAILRFDGKIICMECAGDADLGSIVSEDDLITRQSIRDYDCYICDRCGKQIRG